MENYDSLNNLLSGLTIDDKPKTFNNPHIEKQISNDKLKNELEKDKDKMNNTMCFRDFSLKQFDLNPTNTVNNLLVSNDKEKKKETYEDMNLKLQNRNNLLSSNRQLHVFDNRPQLTRLGDSK
jgi:hypothetical protein|tara:strand:+ start:2291 stop:2659 length:369 start_codon:yes stop_codon:yes gene_type:complete